MFNLVSVTRRAVLLAVQAFGIPLPAYPAAPQGVSSFDPIATARLRAGEVNREIEASGRDLSVPQPPPTQVFNTGLLLQAGLRALVPVSERPGIALPGDPSPNDPPPLVEAQENYKAVFASGVEATPAQRAAALSAIRTAVQQLSSQGYTVFSQKLSEWLKAQ